MDERLLAKPKYKVGDIAVYKDTDKNGEVTVLLQSIIIGATGYIVLSDKDHEVEWYFETKETKTSIREHLKEEDILYSI